MNFTKTIRDTLSMARSMHDSSDNSDGIVEEDIRELLSQTFEKSKRIGWLSIEGYEDLFVGRGGAWMCANFLWSYDNIGEKNKLMAMCITVFSHRTGASFQNITSIGLINFRDGNLWMVHQQADGSYYINRNDTLFDELPIAKITSNHSSEQAAEFAKTFGIILSV